MPIRIETQRPNRLRARSLPFLVALAFAVPTLFAAMAHSRDDERRGESLRVRDKTSRVHRAADSTNGDAQGAVAGGPFNDVCGDPPFTIIEGVTPFSTVGAITDGPDEPDCNFIQGIKIGQDIWYEHFAACTGNLTVSLCNNTDYDSRIAVYDGCGRCPTEPSAIACDDDTCSPRGPSEVVVPVSLGTCYRIRVGGFGSSEGEGEMLIRCDVPPPPTGACCGNSGCVGTMTEASCASLSGVWFTGENCGSFTCPPPPHDLCANAIEVFTETPYEGFTGGATGGDITQACSIADGADVWHVWTARCTGTSAISLCDSPAPFDSTLAVFDACGGDELDCDDDTCGFASASELSFDVVDGETYYIRIAGVHDSGTDDFLAGEYTLTIGDCLDKSPRACCGGPNLSVCVDDVTPQTCTGVNAFPQPPGAVCGGLHEACCLVDGSCVDVDPTCCIGQGGTPAGTGSQCLTDINDDGTDDACEGLIDTITWKDFNDDATGGYLPDFDQNQDYDNADLDGLRYTGVDEYYGGPTAVADLFWWLDSKFSTLDVVAAGVTPAMLIQDLALRMATSGQSASPWGHATPYRGTWLDDLKTGIRSYLNSRGLSDVFDESVVQAPTFDTVADHLLADDNVLLLLGFYHVESATQIPGSGFLVNWQRTGGHYVAVAGIDRDNLKIALSDPDADAAEEGRFGQVRGGDHDHDGDQDPNTDLVFRDPIYDHSAHDDKGFGSHDVYLAVLNEDPDPAAPQPIPGGAWLLSVDGDPLTYGGELAQFHDGSSGGAFDLDAGSFLSDAFLLDNGFADPVTCQTYTVVEATVVMTPTQNAQGCCFTDGTCADLAPVPCALADGVHRGPDTFCLGDLDVSGTDDICEACLPLSIGAVLPSSGTIDARQPHDPDATLPRLGLGTVAEPIRMALSATSPGFARCLTLCESAEDPILGANSIASVTEAGPNQFEIVLEHAITAGAATTLAYNGGAIDFTSHPANVDADSVADASDVTAMIDCCLMSECGPGWDAYNCDLDRSGGVGPSDLLRVIDLLQGGAAWDTWTGTPLPTPPVCP